MDSGNFTPTVASEKGFLFRIATVELTYIAVVELELLAHIEAAHIVVAAVGVVRTAALVAAVEGRVLH